MSTRPVAVPPAVPDHPAGRRDGSYATFVAEQRPGLLRTAQLLTGGDPGRAEELVRTALVELYLLWPWCGPAGPLARARRGLVDAALAEDRRTPAATGPGADPVLAALAGLPAATRVAVVLRHVEGAGVTGTAALLGWSERAVRRETARGRRALRAAVVSAG